MIKDINNVTIEIGDIVKIENSPIKSDNATYVVGQDGTSTGYSGSDLTMYKVAKHKGGYSLSKSTYNICFYPLCNYSNKYKYTREEMNAATIEILLKADNTVFNLVKNDDKHEAEETEETYFRAVVKSGEKDIQDTSYPASQKEKMIAFFSNITLKQGETIEIVKQDHTWGNYNRNVAYKLESIETPTAEIVTEVQQEEIPAQEEQTKVIQKVTQDQPEQQEIINTIERKYFYINEQLAKSSQTLWSFSDYKPNSATNGYKAEVEKAYKIVDKIAIEKPNRLQEALTIAERYAKAYAEWKNKGYSIEMMCPSVMICGAGNFPVRKKEKQNNARDKHMKDYEYINGYLKKLENVLYGKEIIKSGDADAVEKLQEKLDQLEKSQKEMKETNAYYRKNKTLKGYKDITEEQAEKLDNEIINSWYKVPYASFSLTNNNAKIKNTKERLEQLQKAKETPTQESETIQTDICKVIENTELMRIQLLFDGKPDEQTRSILKSNGFRWAPSQGAWQRQLTNNARYSTKKVIEQLEKLTA